MKVNLSYNRYISTGYRLDILLPFTSYKTFTMEPELKQYFFVMLTKGPQRGQDDIKAAEIQRGHLENIDKLKEAGKILVSGPFADDGDWRGILIFDVESEREAEALVQSDPAVISGRLSYKIHPWLTKKGGTFK